MAIRFWGMFYDGKTYVSIKLNKMKGTKGQYR